MKSGPPLIVHTECSMGWGGQEIRIMEELKGMRRHGFSTALMAPEKSRIFQRAADEGIDVHPVSFTSKLHLPSWIHLYWLISRLRPDVINTHSSEDSWMAGLIARQLHVPLVIRTRHVSTPIGSTFSYRHGPHLILTTSQAIREDLVRKGLDSRSIVSMPTGIDLQRFRFSKSHREGIRKDLGISESDVLVGNICVLRSWKGLDFFIDTAAAMPEGYKFILVGDGPQRDRLQQKASDLGLNGRLVFAGHQEQVERYFSALDVFFFTSYASEGVPQSLLQALNVGVPIVACRTPSVMETLRGLSRVIDVDYGDTAAGRSALEYAGRHFTRDGDDGHQQSSHDMVGSYGLEHMLTRLVDLYRAFGIFSSPAR